MKSSAFQLSLCVILISVITARAEARKQDMNTNAYPRNFNRNTSTLHRNTNRYAVNPRTGSGLSTRFNFNRGPTRYVNRNAYAGKANKNTFTQNGNSNNDSSNSNSNRGGQSNVGNVSSNGNSNQRTNSNANRGPTDEVGKSPGFVTELIIGLAIVSIIGLSVLGVRRISQKNQPARIKNNLPPDSKPAQINTTTALSNDYDVFLSYRRELSAEAARLMRAELRSKGFRVFLDVEDLRSGHFDQALLKCIANTPNFLVVLAPHSLAGCSDQNDWFRKEIAWAIKSNRNIIPVFMPGFKFPELAELPDEIRVLRSHQSVTFSHEFFDAMIEKIKQYLKD
ncbi:MAG: toll/interleukin-1 receptor domain-containing protein [Blastocatellia bacterium]